MRLLIFRALMFVLNPKRSTHLFHPRTTGGATSVPTLQPGVHQAVIDLVEPVVDPAPRTPSVGRPPSASPYALDDAEEEKEAVVAVPPGRSVDRLSAGGQAWSPRVSVDIEKPTAPRPPTTATQVVGKETVQETMARLLMAEESVTEDDVATQHMLLTLYGPLFCSRLTAEFVGTLILVFLICGLSVTVNLSLVAPGVAGLASGLVLIFLIYSMGAVSGAHLNPGVTWLFTLRGSFSLVWLPFYVLAQLGGALVGAGLLRAVFGAAASAATPTLAASGVLSEEQGFWLEVLLGAVLQIVVLAMSQRGGNIGPHAALSVGFCFGSLEMFGWTLTGGSLNPVRALAPALVSGPLTSHHLWLYIVAPFISTFIAVPVTRLFSGPLKEDDYPSAQGLGQPQPDTFQRPV